MDNKSKKNNIFNLAGLSIANLSYQETLDFFEKKIEKKEKVFSVTLNLDILRLAYYDKKFFDVINSANIIIADGMPLIWLSRLFKQPLKERVAGRKIVYDLCQMSNDKGYKVFMLGAAEGVADKAKLKLEKKMPNIKIVGTYSPFFGELNDEAKNAEIIKKINDSGADILFVALGAPKQETWLYNNLSRLNPYVYIPCGGSIDFIAGAQIKSPEWIANIGLEWIFRLFSNPKRMFKRYIILDLPFLIKILLGIVDLKKNDKKTGFTD